MENKSKMLENNKNIENEEKNYMKFELNIKIDPSAQACILAVLEFLEKKKLKSKESLKEESNVLTSGQTIKNITLTDVRTALVSLTRQGKQDEVKGLIKRFGGNKLTDIDTEHYEQLFKEAQKLKNLKGEYLN